MGPATILLISLALIGYAYVGYPALCWLRARRWPRPVKRAAIRPRVTVIIAAWREAKTIGRKLRSLAEQDYPAELVDVIVACDGSDDGTPYFAGAAGRELGGRLHVLALTEHRGKPAALNAAVAEATGEIIVFTDARQPMSKNAVSALVENFADASVGAAGGELVLAGDAPAGAYWRYEAALRKWESAAGSTVGVSGALYALRRELWRPLPDGVILDDVLVPMRARLAGKRVVLETRAQAYDQTAESAHEFRRKVRTLSGNFQLLALEPRLMSPTANPEFFGLVSHKLMRLLVPYAMVAALVSSAMMHSLFGALFFGAQCAAYALAIVRALGAGQASKLARLCETVVVLNVAAVVGTFRFLRHGRRLQW
jgi:cellulose synthase/poly-beta-1,6-N-acetylglucosamine synthase-like glycosyltransferase